MHTDNTLEVTAKYNNENDTHRPAKEVFLFMHPTVRISRNIRALWFFDHLHKKIKIGPDPYERSSQIEVVGIVPEEGSESFTDEEFLITENTLVTYMSHLYRLVFILDMSPSTFVVESNGSVLQLRVMASLRRSLENVTKEFRYPGSSRNQRPKFYISICVFSPFIAVAGDHVLLQGVLLDSENLESVMKTVSEKLDHFLANLWKSANNQLCTWNNERRRMRFNGDGLATLVYNESAECDSRGFVQPEWALVFMLRMGLLGVQMLPENTQSNIIVITDGVVGMPNAQAMAQLLTQLRSFTVSCSFIQLTPPLADDTVFGNFSSPELLQFLAMATFGTYIYDQGSIPESAPLQLNVFHRAFLCWSFQRALASNDFIYDLVNTINPEFASLSNRDIVKRVYKKNMHTTSLENLLYVRLREGYTVRRVQIYTERTPTGMPNSDVEYCEHEEEKEATYLLVELRLPWKPLVFISYDIRLPWTSSSSSSKRENVRIEVCLEAPFHLLKDFLSSEKFASEQRQNSVDALKSSMYSVIQADRLLLHIHRFNSDPQYYTIPGEVTEAFALFTCAGTVSDQSIAVSRDMEMRNKKFVDFWYLVCGMDEGIWQKWVHTHTTRMILSPDEPLPSRLFTGKTQLSVRTSFTKLHDLLRELTSFTLVQFQSYIKFVYGPENTKVPKYFYIVRTSQEGPCVILKIAFLGGIGAPDRKRVEGELKRQLTTMAIPKDLHYTSTNKFPEFKKAYERSKSQSYSITKREQPAVTIITKPLERILIRYKDFPKNYDGVVRLEDDTHDAHIKDIVLHNSVANYLVCRRRIWCIPKIFKKAEPMSFEAAEYILYMILQRHLHHGFKIAHSENGVFTLCRQSPQQTIEQFVIFPPAASMNGYKGPENGGSGNAEAYHHSECEMFLITEMWSEPDSSLESDEEALYNMSTKRVENDVDIIAVLATFDQLTRACETHLKSCVIFGLPTCKERKPFDHLNYSVAMSHSTFDLCILVKNSTEKHLLLFPAIGFDDSDPKSRQRLGNLLHCLHCEMTSVSDVCLDIKDGSAWYDMVDDLDYAFDDTESKRSKQDREKNVAFKNMRVYASRISPWRLIVVVMLVGIDDVLEVTSTENPAVPVLVFHLDEPMMAKKIALCENESPVKWHIDDFRNRKENILAMLNQQIQENKNSCESAIEYCWFQKSRVPEEQGIFNTLFCFSSYCDIIEEKVFSRAFVAAVFCSLTDEVYVPEDVFREAMEDRSDHTSISIAGISRIQSAVCTHMDLFHENFDYGCDEDASSQLTAQTCGESLLNIDYLMQRYNFKPVPNMPTYFFYCPNLDPERDDIVLHTMTIEAVDTADISPMSEDESQAEEEEAESPIEQAAPSVINESVNSEHDSEEFAPCDEDIQSNHSNNADDEHLEDEEDEQQSSKEEEKEESAESSEEPLSDRSSFAYANDLDVTSELSHRDIDEYWQSYLDFCPLFVQFSCTVKSLEGSIVNFPLSRLPYCLMECFDKRRSSEMFGSEITIDMYVLTWTSPLSTISAQYFEDVQRDNNSYDYNKMYSSQFSFRMDDDVLERSNYAKSGLLDDLPHRESSTILQLQSGLENLMESERLLFLSRMRSENATKGNINDIVEFVKGARDAFLDDFEMLSPNCQPFVSISYNEYNCKFVIDWAEGVTRLAGLLDGHIICANSYVLSALPRRKKENRLYLYCDSVDSPSPASTKHEHHHHHCHQFFDCDRQDEWIGVDQEQQSSGNSMSECHQMNDFWLVVKAEKKTNKIGVYLCQRHSMVNDAAFEELCAFIRKSVRQTNQEILLERLQKTFTCDSLLVAPSSREEPNEKLDSLSSEDDFGPSLPELDPHRFVNFRTGHFACDNVWNHWFEIHPRLMGARSTGELTDMMGTLPIEKIAETTWARPTGEAAENTIYAPAALFALTMGLQQLAVRNRKNLFVFLDDSGHRYYLRLHCSKESYFDTCSTPRSKEWLNENISRFNSSILLSCYGVNEPNEQLTVCLRDVLQKRLDQSVMEDIVSSLAKNKQAQLNVTDVNFIQPERSDPFTTVYFTIPKLIDDFLGSYAFFLKQLLLTFSVTPRIRERSGSSRKSSSASSAFMPFLTQSSKAEFTGIQDSSAFFLVVRPHASGSRNMGIALLDVSFVRPDGNPHDLPRPPNISLSITRRIYPATNSSYGTGSRGRAVANLSQELTKTRTVASLSEMKFTDANVLVQCAIWQVGDVGLEELQEKVRVSVQQALCDVVTEYGLLSSILFDSSHTPFSPGYRSTDGQRVTSEAQRHHSSDQNHHSTSVQNLPKRSSSGSTSPANLGSGQLQCAPTPSMFPFNGPVHSHSQPSTHPPSVCGDSEYRASDGEDADRILSNGMSKISVAKLQQKNSIEQHRRRASGAPAPIDCLQINFVISMAEWFDHVVKELSKLTTVCKSVRKKEFLLDCDIAASKLTQVIYREVSKVIPRDSLTIYQTYDTDQLKSGKRFQPVSPEDIATKEYQDTGRVLSHVNETIDIVLVGHEKTHFNLRELHSPLSMSDSVRHSECWSTEAYQMHKPDTISNIPRQRLLYLIISGETLTLYMYNYIDELVSKVQRVVDTAVSWINARSWLLRGIGQQKMGICHLNSIKKSELNPNPYMPLTWMNPQLLVECDYPKPQMINFAVHKDISHEKAQIYFRIYRNSEHIFVPTNLNKDSIFFDQTAQMLGMRSDLLTDIETRERLVGVHRDLFSSETSVMKDEIFQEFITRSHNVHFVETPILLLKSWRLRIGEIRAAGHVSHVFSKRKMSFARSTISSVSAGTKSGSLTSSPPKRRTDEEPAMYRIQYMLLKDYVEYLKPFGFRILKVQGGAETKTCCELVDDKIVFNSDVAVSPDFWMYMPIEHGIIFAQLTFFKPYFCVHFHLWNSLTGKSSTDDAAYSDDEMSEQDEEDDEARLSLEHVKNLVISKSHVHSFTYDFHLRTIGTYLMGNDHHGIFDIGFDAEGFLADFLKYYEGRPPNARNCVYEDQVKYEELKVSRSEISDFFLNEKLAEDQWRIMKLRARSVPNSDCYMLISKEKKEFGGENYDKIRVVILDRSQEHRDRQTDNINLKFYVVLLAESEPPELIH
uniref:Protein SZT2 n=1 Tax=Steinernema glaseri TaxID=37863 RepID=A0A1I8AB17_9BILA